MKNRDSQGIVEVNVNMIPRTIPPPVSGNTTDIPNYHGYLNQHSFRESIQVIYSQYLDDMNLRRVLIHTPTPFISLCSKPETVPIM